MLQQHVFRRDGRVRLGLEQPVPIGMLLACQCRAGTPDRIVQPFVWSGFAGQRYFVWHAGTQVASKTSAAARPDLMAPSIVAGNPVAVQSPASARFTRSVRGPGRNFSCAAVAT